MSEKLNFAIDGEFLTNIARDWFWNMNKSYKKCEELLLSCMAGGSEEEKRHVCQDIIEGRKKLVGINEFELVDDNGKVRPLGQKVEELQRNIDYAKGTVTQPVGTYVLSEYPKLGSIQQVRYLADDDASLERAIDMLHTAREKRGAQ